MIQRRDVEQRADHPAGLIFQHPANRPAIAQAGPQRVVEPQAEPFVLWLGRFEMRRLQTMDLFPVLDLRRANWGGKVGRALVAESSALMTPR